MNFAEIWLKRVIQLVTVLTTANWLDGIPELDTEIVEMGANTPTEMNVIHVAKENFNPDVLVNNNVYPIPVQAYTDTEVLLMIDKYQTKATSVSDDQIMGASYDRIDAATRGHVRAILVKKFKKAIFAIAPGADSLQTPVIEATGAVVAGFKTLTYEDLVALKNRFDTDEVDPTNRRLVLSTRHYNNLLLDRKNFGDQLVNYKAGTPAPMIAGFEIYQYNGNPLYTADGVKKNFGAVKLATDREGSVAFWTGGIAKKTGLTKQYFTPASSDTANQSNLLNYRHYFMATPFESRYIGAIY